MPAPQTEVLITVDGVEQGRHVIQPGEYVLGRNADCAIRVEADLVSRQHAKLTLNFDHALIEDLGSSNGTFVNDQPVTERTRLWPSQKIRIGAATVTLRRLQGEAPSDMSLAPAQQAIRRMLPAEMLREKKYDIGAVVARGGMGAILGAREAAIQRKVAMKVMLDTNDAGDMARFIAEAQVTGQLEHPNIPPVHELGVDENGQPFYTMKMVQGITLKKVLDLMAAGTAATLAKYPLAALLTIFQKVCDAIAFAHSKGVIHRDLKPENVMLGDYGEVLVMDWGLAKRLRMADGGLRNESTSGPPEDIHAIRHTPAAGLDQSAIPNPQSAIESTLAGTIMGTPQFMAPEQARGEIEKIDARSDIYSLGAILYQMLALRVSVTGTDAMEVVVKVGRGEIEPLIAQRDVTQRRKDAKKDKGGEAKPSPFAPSRLCVTHLPGGRIPDSLAAVVRKAMSLGRTGRYQSVADLQRDIEAYQHGFATGAEKAGFVKQIRLLVLRHKALFATAFAAWLVITALAVWFVVNVTRERNNTARALDRAENTLHELRRTAPVFYGQAKVVFDEGDFGQAIEKIGYAIDLDGDNADYHLFRANLRQSSQDLAAAAEGYRRVLTLRPADAAAKTNLALCEKLLQETGGAPLGHPQQFILLKALRKQKRLVEAAPLAALVDPDIALAKAAILARLREARNQPGWDDRSVTALPDGTFRVGLYGFLIRDYSVLKDQPVTVLDLTGSGITDLSGLSGLPLQELNLNSSKATDLSPLRGMPLENLDLRGMPVTDLAPLRGMKLNKLLLSNGVSDLSPLAGMPLTYLSCNQCKQVRDLSPLRGTPLVDLTLSWSGVASLAPLAGAPLKRLDVSGTKIENLTPLAQCVNLEELTLGFAPVTDLTPLAKLHLTRFHANSPKLTSIAPLRGQPLRVVNLLNTGVTDLSPLADCIMLEELTLPKAAGDLSMLRNLPRLRFLSTRNGTPFEGRTRPAQTAEEFWKEYDAQQAAGKK